ncbi:hypothetical protein [Oscillibacter sp.]|jgi:hypothetical protein|uniref:hypothetical protein n=1 Tax=Oscillibacter sp. TaxID=1945593 RepID=UPI002D8036D2|nr:hypothetical protein [Oscillibacter sp.]
MVVAVADPRDGLVCYGRPFWAIQELPDFIDFPIDVHGFPSAVASALRQPGQSLSHRTTSAKLTTLIPERIEKSVHDYHILLFPVIATPPIVAGPPLKNNIRDGEKEEDFS